jgi:hypothetical protein
LILVAIVQFLFIFVLLGYAQVAGFILNGVGQLGTHSGYHEDSESALAFVVLWSPALVAFILSGIGLLLKKKWAWFATLALAAITLLPAIIAIFYLLLFRPYIRGEILIGLATRAMVCVGPPFAVWYLTRSHMREVFRI